MTTKTCYRLEITLSTYAGNHEREMAAYVFGFWLYDLEPSDYIMNAINMDDFKPMNWFDEYGDTERFLEINTDYHGLQSTDLIDANTFAVESDRPFNEEELAFIEKRCHQYPAIYNQHAPSYHGDRVFTVEVIRQFKLETCLIQFLKIQTFLKRILATAFLQIKLKKSLIKFLKSCLRLNHKPSRLSENCIFLVRMTIITIKLY